MIISVLNIFTIVNKVIISTFLLLKKENSAPTKALSLMVFLPALTVLSNYLLYIEEFRFSALVFINQIGVHILSPLIYIYCMMMMGTDVTKQRKLPVYFITTLIPASCWIIFEFGYSPSEQLALLKNIYSDPDILVDVMNTSNPIVWMFYLSLAYYRVRKFNKEVNNVYTGTAKIKIQYLNEFILLMWLLGASIGLSYLFTTEFIIELIIVPLTSNIFYFYIIYQSINNSVIFNQTEFLDYQKTLAPLRETETEKYQKSSLTPSQIEELHQRVDEILVREKLYLDPDLNIQTLSGKMNLSVNKISEVINRKTGHNFFDFINGYRVEHAKQCLKDPRFLTLTLEAIAEESGFGSKTAFNRAFKKSTGDTPSSYKKKQLEHPVVPAY